MIFNSNCIIFQGQDSQNKRSTTFKEFYSAKQGILLTTGLAERGWDIPKVAWIIQYDPPHIPEVSVK